MALLLLLGLLLFPTLSSADLFDTAIKKMPLQHSAMDRSGVTLRSGANLQTGLRGTTTTLFRGSATIGGSCNAFDFAASMKEAFEAIPQAAENVAMAIVPAAPMLIACTLEPVTCDVLKHWQAMVNVVLQMKYARCEQIQQGMAYLGARLGGGEQAKCLEYQVNSLGYPIGKAMDNCMNTVPFLTAPDGTQKQSINLIQETLQRGGASQEVQQLAQNLLGEMQLQVSGGKMGFNHQQPQYAMLGRYQLHRDAAEAALRQAIQEIQSGGTVSESTRQALAVPGQAVPEAVFDAMAALQRDPIRQQAHVDGIATALGITHLTYECLELQETLEAAIDGNVQLSDAQRKLMQQRLDTLQRELQRVYLRVEQRHTFLVPAYNALIEDYAGIQDGAIRAGLRAPGTVRPAMPFRSQNPLGYGR